MDMNLPSSSDSTSTPKVHLGIVHPKNEPDRVLLYYEDAPKTEDSPDTTPVPVVVPVAETTSSSWDDWTKLPNWQSGASTTWDKHGRTILLVGGGITAGVIAGVGVYALTKWVNLKYMTSWVTSVTASAPTHPST